MADQVELRCRCGEVRARVTDASPRTVNRVVCYCADCQAFVHQIGRADLLDAKGGSDIVQVAPDAITFTQGQDRIVGVRLSPKGLFRWYANCCNSPVGNSMTPALPFVGFLPNGFKPENRSADEAFGPPVGAILGKSAIGTPPPGSTGLNLPLLLRAVGKVLGWRLRGKAWPHPFFAKWKEEPVYPVKVLSKEERDALRPLCGPKAEAH